MEAMTTRVATRRIKKEPSFTRSFRFCRMRCLSSRASMAHLGYSPREASVGSPQTPTHIAITMPGRTVPIPRKAGRLAASLQPLFRC